MRKRKKSFECANCHHTFKEVNNYCPSCGQENHTHKLPIKHFAMELVESFTHFDTKVYTTFKEMVLKPGVVAKNYNSNKRARYVPPIRIYVFMSFIFFFLITVLYSHKVEDNSQKLQAAFRKDFDLKNMGTHYINIGKSTKINKDLFIKLVSEEKITNSKIDSLLISNNINTNWFNTRVLHTIIKLYKGETTIAEIYSKLVKYISYALLIFMPFFAMVLKVFYRKKHQYYSEFLVFSIYFHTFLFAVLGLCMIINRYIFSNNYLFAFFAMAAIVYMGLSLKKVYEDSVLKTILKTSLISVIYCISLVFLIALMFIGSLL
jgi:Protein of unknown function (DUF3667)